MEHVHGSCELVPSNHRGYWQHSGAHLGDVEVFLAKRIKSHRMGHYAQIEVTDHLGGSFLNFEPVRSLKFTLDLTGRDMGSTVQMAGIMGSTGPTISHRNDPLD
jgi:hypothetical protein